MDASDSEGHRSTKEMKSSGERRTFTSAEISRLRRRRRSARIAIALVGTRRAYTLKMPTVRRSANA
jgi:hypothetical protein